MKSSEAQTAGFLPVKVNVPIPEYKRLFAEAQASRVSVGDVILRRLARPKRGGARPGSGRPSGYTRAVAEQIAEGRRLSMSWPEISVKFGIATDTARRWLTRYENEQRESAETRGAS